MYRASMKRLSRSLGFSLILLAGFLLPPVLHAQTSMTVSSFDGPVTSTEVSTFLAYVTAQTPAANNIGNNWAQGTSGEDTKAMAMVYQITHNTAILDQMIRFCDALLSERDDLAPAPTGQIVIWTGSIDPVWPNTTTTPIGTGGEQGDPVGHLANCARLILETPSIWNTTVPIGDPDGYGATYLERAETYVNAGDYTISNHILKSELDLSNDDHQYFAAADPYKGGLPVPWNQQMMFDYAFENLAIAHDILGDNPTLAARYHQIVQDSVDWFFTSGVTSFLDSDDNTAYSWGYSMPSTTEEDNNHGSLDVNGFYRLYMTGEYGITPAMMTPFGNTFVDIMTLGPGDYSGKIDGTTGSGNSASTDYIRSGWLLTSDFLPNDYETMMSADFTPGGTTTNADRFSKFLWLKNKRYQSFTFAASPSAQTVEQGNSTTYTATVTAQGAFAGDVTLSVTGLPAGATASFSPATINTVGASTLTVQTTSAIPAGTYPLLIMASSMGTVTQTANVNLVAGQQVSAPTFSPAGGSYTSSQSITISTSTPGASIRYTTDGSTPSETNGTLYSGPVAVSATTTLNAIAYETGYVDSTVASATYTYPPPPTFTVGVSPTSQTISSSQQAQFAVTIAPVNGFNQPVSFSCSGLPATEGCSFSPSTVTPAGTPATLTLTISSTAEASAGSYPLSSPWSGWGLDGVLASLIFLPFRRRRIAQFLLLALFAVVGFGLTGCSQSNSTTTGVAPQTYTVSVSAVGGGVTQTTPISLTIQQ